MWQFDAQCHGLIRFFHNRCVGGDSCSKSGVLPIEVGKIEASRQATVNRSTAFLRKGNHRLSQPSIGTPNRRPQFLRQVHRIWHHQASRDVCAVSFGTSREGFWHRPQAHQSRMNQSLPYALFDKRIVSLHPFSKERSTWELLRSVTAPARLDKKNVGMIAHADV